MRLKIYFVCGLLFVFILIYLFIKGCFFHPSLNTKKLRDKNIILISIDTLRADHLGTYGYYRNTSPFIDKLAEESIVFEQAFSASGYTLPSHTSLFTGLYPRTHKVRISYAGGKANRNNYKKTSLDKKYKTLAEHLFSIGYHTLWVGPDEFSEQLSPATSEGRGFQTKILTHDMAYLPKFFKWLDSNPNKKFLAFFHTDYVHDPYFNKSQHPYYDGNIEHYPVFSTSNYKGSILGNITETLHQLKLKYPKTWQSIYNDYYKGRKFWWSFVDLKDPKDVQRLKDLYDDCILAVDYKIARLISILKAKNLYKNTIIILVSDHGEAFGEHGKFMHDSVHREILHVPFILYIPEFGSKRIQSRVSLIDVYPTILDLIGQSPLHQMDGKSLLPLIKGTKRKVHDYIFGSLDAQISVSDGKWKLIRTGGKLYHVRKDPYEKKDVSDKYPKILEKLDQKIDTFLHDLED